MSRDETPVLALRYQGAVVPAPEPAAVAGDLQRQARESQCEERPPALQSPMSDVFNFREKAFVHNGYLNDCAIVGAESGRLPDVTEGSRMHLIRTPRRVAQQGFTLLEIMVVVVIIGLLAAIVVPNFIGNIDTAAKNRAKQDIRGIETALNLFRLDNFKYPSTADGLQALVTNPGEASAPNWKQQLPRMPIDPWNKPYQYAYPGQHGEFDVFSYGADGQEGGEGINADIGNWEL
jgi:general secretion pathway protein G